MGHEDDEIDYIYLKGDSYEKIIFLLIINNFNCRIDL